jgi:hypothetical protein
MAKRFTDTDKWKKDFIKSLPIEYKCFWFFILDDCDHAGIWHVDFEIAEMRLGIKLSQQKARGFFGERVVEFDNSKKWFIPDFIHFQYGEFTEKNKLYKTVTSVLKKYNLMEHLSPINGVKEQDKEKDQEKEKEIGGNLEYNARDTILSSRIDFEAICMSTGKTEDQAKHSLEKFHLYNQKKNSYPMNRTQMFAGFKLWLMNETGAVTIITPTRKPTHSNEDNQW